MVAGAGFFPSDGFAINSEFAGFAPLDVLSVDIEGGGARDVDATGDAHVEADFLRNIFASDVLAEFFEVAFAFGDIIEVLFEKSGAFGAGGRLPFGLRSEEFVGIRFPVALEPGCFGSGGGGSAIFMIGEKEVAIYYGEFAIELLKSFVDFGVNRGTAWALVVGVFENENRSIGVAFNMVGDVAGVLICFDDSIKIVVVVVGGLIVAVDDEEGGDSNYCYNCNGDYDSDGLKAVTIFHE